MGNLKDLQNAAVPERSASSALADRLKNIGGNKVNGGVGGDMAENVPLVRKTESVVGTDNGGKDAKKGQSFFVKARKVPEKNTMMTIRTKPEVKERFDALRSFFGFSQSDFFERMLIITEEQARKEGWKG